MSDTDTDTGLARQRDAAAGSANTPGQRVVGLARRSWRQLTSMRTALVLLFLLAVAAVPGSLLPQRSVSAEKVARFLADHPTAGPLVDRAYGFNVYGSPWFSAIYLLLFVSLIGCLVPRLRAHAVALWRRPPPAPRHLDRLPQHAVAATGPVADPAAAAEGLRALLRSRRFRVTVREEAPGRFALSAEKGHLKETGNLLFHFALLGLLIGVAYGSLAGWHGNRLLVAGPENAFCDSLQQYDEYGLGAAVDGGDLPPFCLRLGDFHARYTDAGQPVAFAATIGYRTAGGGAERTRSVSVNAPLRLARANVYLLGHGYAPQLRYTDRYGRTQTVTAPFLPRDNALTSDGVALFPDANLDPKTGKPDGKGQIGFNGVYLPTVPPDPSAGGSLHPEERDPRLMLQAYQGDLGLDAGTPLSVYSLDSRQLRAGRLTPMDQPHLLRVGESWTLSDGSSVEFLGTRPWVALAVRWDPGEPVVLGGAICLLIGLLVSLTGRRRRVWLRVTGDGVTAGGLSRGGDDQAFHAEFHDLVRQVAQRFDDAGPGELHQEGYTKPVPAG